MTAALLATLAHPRWWAAALAAFLVRGGIVLLAVPILALPSVSDLGATLGTTIARLALGHPIVLVALGIGAGLGTVGALLAVGALGAWFEQALVAEALADEEIEAELAADAGDAADPGDSAGRARQVAGALPALAARLVAHVPTAAILGWAGFRLGFVAADELLRPGPGGTVMGRVIAGAPEAIVAPIVVWVLAELVAGIAVRRMDATADPTVLSVIRDVLGAAGDVVRHPRLAVAWLLGSAAVAATVLPTWLAISVAFERVRAAVADEPTALALGPALLSLVATWIAGLGLIGLAVAWRSVATTVAVARVARPAIPSPSDG